MSEKNSWQTWRENLTERQQQQLEMAEEYVKRWKTAGAPGHSHFELLARLAEELDLMAEEITGVQIDGG